MVSLNTFLNQVVYPVKPEEKLKYRWACEGSNLKYKQLKAGDKVKLEESLALMNQKIQGYLNSVDKISEEEKAQLLTLSEMVNVQRDAYKESHRGIRGRLYLMKAGHEYGHINKLGNKVLHNIDRLAQKEVIKPPPEFPLFIDSVAPIIQEDFNYSMLNPEKQPKRQWLLVIKTGLVKDCLESDVEKMKKGEVEQISVFAALERINEHLNAYEGMKEINETHRDQLLALGQKITERSGELKAKKEIDVITQLNTKIAGLVKKPRATPPTEEKMREMKIRIKKNHDELLNTETTYNADLKKSVSLLKEVISLREDKKVSIKCDERYKKYFKSDAKKTGFFNNLFKKEPKLTETSLDQALAAFEEMEQLSGEFHKELEKALKRKTLAGKNRDLARLYSSDLFRAYSKSAALCARHQELLAAFYKDLSVKNPDLKLDSFKASAAFITPVQRMPRHVMLLTEIFNSTPNNNLSYRDIHLALIKAKQNAADVNVRMNWPFRVKSPKKSAK